MGQQTTPNFRGKGVSAKKFTKTGEPKHAGNWSERSIHYQSLQSKDYYVRLLKSKEDPEIKMLIVGDHTPLYQIMGGIVEQLAINDEHFYMYRQQGKYDKISNGKLYDCSYTLMKNPLAAKKWMIDPFAFKLRVEIYTEGDFTYNFPEY